MIGNKFLDFRRLLNNENRSRDEILRIQETKLVRLIRHAYENVPMYRDLFEKAGIVPDDIRSVEDLRKIPVIDKGEFKRRKDSERLDRRISDNRRLIPVNTSGSSGLALRFYIESRYEQFRKAQYLRPYWSNGQRPWDNVMRISARNRQNQTWFRRVGLMREHRFPAGSDPDAQIEWINRYKPSVLQGYPSALNLLASRVMETGLNVHLPRIVFTDSEILVPEWRRRIEAVFGSRVIDVYGSHETENIAHECAMHSGFHIASDCVVMEFVGSNVTSGGDHGGRIVCTVLDNYTHPFIRYSLGDIGAPSAEHCECGSPFPLMKVISGRSDDYAIGPNGEKKPALTLLAEMDPFAADLREYQIIQEEINSIRVLLVPSTKFNGVTERLIREKLQGGFPAAEIQIERVEQIARNGRGKFRAFISKVRTE